MSKGTALAGAGEIVPLNVMMASGWHSYTADRKEGLTQAGAAKRLKVSQPRISDLTRGKISRFSLDTLVNMLTDAGLEVDFRIKPSSRRLA